MNRISDQVRSDAGEKSFSSLAKISPSLVEPKKAVQAAVHMTCLDKTSQGVFAILLPSVNKRGKVTTLLVDVTAGLEREWWKEPFKIRANILSPSKCSQERPLRWWVNLRAER